MCAKMQTTLEQRRPNQAPRTDPTRSRRDSPSAGARRFRPPEDLVTLPQVQGGDADAEEAAPFFDAGEVAAACSQPNDPWGGAAPQRRPPPPGRAEDCLYLNVFAPAGADRGSDARLPVLVFVHGGGFIAGTERWRMQVARFAVWKPWCVFWRVVTDVLDGIVGVAYQQQKGDPSKQH